MANILNIEVTGGLLENFDIESTRDIGVLEIFHKNAQYFCVFVEGDGVEIMHGADISDSAA